MDPSHGWIGFREDWTVIEGSRATQTVVIQQRDGSFASVRLISQLDEMGANPVLVTTMAPGGVAVIEVSNDYRSVGRALISVDRGRTWEVRSIPPDLSQTRPQDWRAWPVIESSGITVSRLTPVSS